MRVARSGAILLLAAVSLSLPAATRAQTAAWQTVITLPETTSPHGVANGVAIDLRGGPTGTKWAYTVDTASHRVIKFGTGGKLLASWPLPSAAMVRDGVAVDGQDNVYVASGTNDLWKYSPYGKLLASWSKFGGLRDVAVDSRGDVYLAQQRRSAPGRRAGAGSARLYP
jgi:hypothetical protein